MEGVLFVMMHRPDMWLLAAVSFQQTVCRLDV